MNELDPRDRERRMSELGSIARGDSVLDALAVAIAVETAFDIVLADEEIVPERLCSPEALARTIGSRLGGA